MNSISGYPTYSDTVALGSRMSAEGKEFVLVYSTEAKAKGEFQTVRYTGTQNQSPQIGDAVTLASVYQKVGVVTEATTAAGYLWLQVRGVCEALVDGTTDVAAGDFLEVLNATVCGVKDATTRSVNSVAIALEAQTANAATLTKVQLLGFPVITAAS